MWTGGRFTCSNAFVEEMKNVFNKIDEYAKLYKKWSAVEDKMDTIYYPIIKLFVTEIKRLGIVNQNDSIEKQENARMFTKAFLNICLVRRISISL